MLYSYLKYLSSALMYHYYEKTPVMKRWGCFGDVNTFPMQKTYRIQFQSLQ